MAPKHTGGLPEARTGETGWFGAPGGITLEGDG